MHGITSQVLQWVMGGVAVVLTAVGALFALPRLRGLVVRYRWWLAGLVAVGLAVLVFGGMTPKFGMRAGSVLPRFRRASAIS